MTKFWELFEESVILQAILTVGIWTVILILFATGKEVPDTLIYAGTTILGFYFGSKQTNAVMKALGGKHG